MNEKARLRFGEFDEMRPSAKELRQNILENKMMSLLCHCSAEIDPSTELFYSVNHMFLGSGSYMLLLFSEISPISQEQSLGQDVYSRFYLYTLIQEELLKLFEGHFTIHTAELDGRLVALLIFHYGAVPAIQADLMQLIEKRCIDLSESLKENYDLHVISYLGQIMDEIPLISSVYDKLLSASTFHRYVNHKFDRPIFYLPKPKSPLEKETTLSAHDHAKAIANAMLSHEDYRQYAILALDALINEPLLSIEELKKHSGDLFEALCQALSERGFRFQHKKASEDFQRENTQTTSWDSSRAWFLNFLDEVYAENEVDENTQRALLLEKAEGYIEERIHDPSLTITDISDTLSVSIATLNALFRRQLNLTPAKYIRQKRLNEALLLLQKSDLSVKKVAESCGFGSLETFHRLFRQEYGISPGILKNKNSSRD